MDSLVFSNMLHRPARTIVSVLGIAIGVLLIIFTYGMANGSLREQANRDGNVGAQIFFRASGSTGLPGSEPFLLPASVVPNILNVEGVQSAILIGVRSVDADTALGKRPLDGVNFDEYAEMAGLHIIQGRKFTDRANEAIIDTAFQKQKKLKIDDTIKLYDRDFKIVGTYEPASGSRVKIPLSTMQMEELNPDKEQIPPDKINMGSAILVKTKPGFDVDEVAQRLSTKFPDNPIILTRELEEIYLSSIPALGVFLNVIISVAAAISALVILLTMYTTVTERTRQIGILKSLGLSNAGIAWLITQEALLLSFGGILTGVILTYLLRFGLKLVMTLEVEISFLVIGITLLVGLIGGAVGALYPALRAARLDAVEALSYE